MRLPDWDQRLMDVVSLHVRLPGEWGVSDCWMATCDAHEAVTGNRLLPDLRGYASERDGYRLFAAHGFGTVEAAIASVLDPRPFAGVMRGDIGVVDQPNGPSCGVLVANGLAVKRITGSNPVEGRMAFVPIDASMRFFAVN